MKVFVKGVETYRGVPESVATGLLFLYSTLLVELRRSDKLERADVCSALSLRQL